MSAKRGLTFALMFSSFGAGLLLGNAGVSVSTAGASPAPAVSAQATRVFELRTYTAADGKLEDLLTRFRDHTARLFERHGMSNIGYWTPQEGPGNTLVYLISHPSRAQAEANWDAFRADSEWQQAFEESQRDGPLVSNIERVWLDPTDFSPLR